VKTIDETLFPEDLTPGQTLVHPDAPVEARAWEALADERPPIELGRTLGQGGMGLVHLGIQTRLGREVAVKTLRPDVNSNLTRGLLQEAWVTGSLEHPNIVPVYDVSLDAAERPQIVLKRIEGTLWTELLANPEKLPDDATQDPVAWHIGVLITVCRAIEFAHSRDILHRDLKPDNVMIGAFGEVYLLDWGIAVSLDPAADGRFPRPRAGHPTGTPFYIAPEMARGDADALCTRTDVFLLAGLLYEILDGRPPRQGDSVYEVLATAADPIRIDADWPEDLVELLRRGFALEPGDRPDATTFRVRLERHLRRRGLLDLYERSRADAEGLRRDLLATDAHTDPDARIELYERYQAARFGFREVLGRWPEHEGASEALRQLALAMAEYELGERDPRAARVLLAQVTDPPDGLEAAILDLERQLEADRAQLAHLTREASLQAGARTRTRVLATMVVVWLAAPIVLPLMGVEHGFGRFYAVVTNQLLVAVALIGWSWREWVTTRFNRMAAGILIMQPAATLILAATMQQWGLNALHANVGEVMVSGMLVWLVALGSDRRLLPSALLFLPGIPVIVLYPEWVHVVAAPLILGVIANVYVLRDWLLGDTD
jgi:serine/threonine-protein kinase